MSDSFQTPILIVLSSESDALAMMNYLTARLPFAHFAWAANSEQVKSVLPSQSWRLVICGERVAECGWHCVMEIVSDHDSVLSMVVVTNQYDEAQAISAMRRGARDYLEHQNQPRLQTVVERELSHSESLRGLIRVQHRADLMIHYDDLTGLPNRNLFCEWVSKLLQSKYGGTSRLAAVTAPATRPVVMRAALLYFDVDRFMRVNDAFGHTVGDQFLQIIALRLKELVGEHPLARIGEDKFAIMLSEVDDESEVESFIYSIQQRFEKACIVDQYEFFFTFTVGVSFITQTDDNIVNLLKNAESAMFVAKRNTPHGIQFFRPENRQEVNRKVVLETALRHALVRGELSLCYQPIVCTASKRFIGAEALLRWNQRELGMVSPDEFIPIADDSGFIIEIGRWVLLTACKQAKQWHDMGFTDLTVAINFSASQFRHPGLVAQVKEAIRISGIDPHTLEIEITETVAMQDAPSTIAKLKTLKSLGIKISIDDFGTGYSSLAYLKKFPIDILKIDKAFVRDVDSDVDNAAIVRAVAALARALRLTVLAEGVENTRQLDFLNLIGCDRVQGYYFSKPQDSDWITELIIQHNPSQAYQDKLLESAMARLGLVNDGMGSHATTILPGRALG